MRKVPILIGILGIAVGFGLIIANSASMGFHSCSNGGDQPLFGTKSATPCSGSTELLDIAGTVICILGVLAAVAANAVIRRRAGQRIAPPVDPDDPSDTPFGT